MKKIYSLVLLMLLTAVMGMNTAKAANVIASGDGWELYDNKNLLVDLTLLERHDYQSASELPWYDVRNQVQKVTTVRRDFSKSVPKTLYINPYMFAEMYSLREISIDSDVKQLIICAHAFENSTIHQIWNYYWTKIVGVREYAFKNCKKMESFHIDGDGSTDAIAAHAFEGCTNLKTIYGEVTGKVHMYAFKGCTALEEIGLSRVYAIDDYAFDGCSQLQVINLQDCWNIGKYAFRECNLASISMKEIQSIADYAFYDGIQNNAHLYIDRNDAPSVGTDAFYGAPYNVTLHVPDNATGYNKAPWTNFRSETDPPEIYAALSGTTVTFYYDDQCSTRHGTSWSTTEYYKLEIKNTATKIVIDASMSAARPTNMDNWFQNFTKVTEIENLSNLNTADVTDMGSLFFGCSSLTTIDINGLDMSSAQDIRFMFSQCTNLQKIYCEKDWSQMSNITNAYNMFEGCTSLVGGRGTAFDSNHKELEYAHPDGGADAPGYFWRAGDTGEEPLPFNPDEGIDQINNNQSPITNKTIKDGQLLILRGDKTYTIQGQEVK